LSDVPDTFGVYVHWPFCLAKCPYCDFNSHVHHGAFDEDAFVAAYLTELATIAARVPSRTVTSVFFGGGTPSLMSEKAVATILEAIADRWDLDPDVEITLEANPTSVEAGRFRGYRASGVNRLSLGVQSLVEDELKALGRQHSVAEAVAALRLAQSVFDRVSFDLIYARPGQSPDAWRYELTEALALASGHLSAYQLTIEQGTRFFDLFQAGRLVTPDAGTAAELFEVTRELCAATGLPAYEISNFARPGQESRHNLVYWRYGEYAGIGPGAHGRLRIDGARHATATEKRPFEWAARVAREGHGLVVDEPLSTDEEADEYLLMGLRLAAGISPERYRSLAGRPLRPAQIEALADVGFVRALPDGNLAVTDKGWLVLDAVVADLAA
jgi:putative oxygen-independent coproporphyrinogen III oxidase